MKHLLVFLTILVALSGCKSNKATSQFNFHFATLEEGQKIISTSDAFTQSFHTFDLVSRLQDAGLEPTEGNYLQLCRTSVMAWTPAEMEYLEKSAARLQKRIDSCGYKLPIPKNISLIKTSMVEEGGAGGYTRGTCIFLAPCENITTKRESYLDFLMAHELFHVMTRHNPEFRKAMYEQIGFKILDKDIEFNDRLLEMRITNPDVNRYDSYSIFEIEGKDVPCTMLFYNDREYAGGPFFTYGKPGLVPLDADFKPVMDSEGNPIIYNPKEVESFFKHIGKNTGYIINPEEALADNFAFALMDYFPKGNPSPEVTARLREVMKGSWIK